MAKSPSKATASIEVIEDSEEERPKSTKKKDDSAAENSDNGDVSEEEYEIEAILDAKAGAFAAGRMGYLVKWKGYGSEHNSWVDQADAAGATQMIDEYWEKNRKNRKIKQAKQAKGPLPRKSDVKASSPEVDEPSSSNKRKKAASASRKSKSSQPEVDDPMEADEEEEIPKTKKQKTTPRSEKSEEMDVDVDEHVEQDGQYLPMDTTKFKEKSWEKLVKRVDTIEKIDGVLKVFFTLNNGDKVVETSRECAKHFPQKLIQFYESNLRWRESEQ